jgi:hypothetical protein
MLLAPFFDERENPRRRRIHLIGARVEKLERGSQPAGAGDSFTSPRAADVSGLA